MANLVKLGTFVAEKSGMKVTKYMLYKSNGVAKGIQKVFEPAKNSKLYQNGVDKFVLRKRLSDGQKFLSVNNLVEPGAFDSNTNHFADIKLLLGLLKSLNH